jgi:hypothetical protein
MSEKQTNKKQTQFKVLYTKSIVYYQARTARTRLYTIVAARCVVTTRLFFAIDIDALKIITNLLFLFDGGVHGS